MANKNYTIHRIQKDDVGKVMKLLKKTFYLDEPLNHTIGLCKDEYDPCPGLDEYCQHSMLEGLSFMAVDAQGNAVAAIVSGSVPLKEDIKNELLMEAQNCKEPKFQKILYIIASREEGAKLWKQFPNDSHLVEVKAVATDQNWRRLGIMNALVEETEKAAKALDVRIIRMDTSSAYSAKSAERMGFKCYYKALYADIKKDGIPLIVPDPPHLEDRYSIYMGVIDECWSGENPQ